MVVFVFTQTDNTSGHFALVFIACSHISGSRSSESHRQSETLRRATHDIRIQRLEQRQRHKVRYNRYFEPRSVTIVYESIVFLDRAIAVRPLDECAEERIIRSEVRI